MGSSPLTSVPVTGCGLQGTLSVPGRGTSHFLLPLPWVGLGAQGRQVALGTGVCRDRAPGASFRLLFLLSSGRSGGVPRSSCPKGSPPRARPGGGGESRTQTREDPETGRGTPCRGPDLHTQVATGRAEMSAQGAPEPPPLSGPGPAAPGPRFRVGGAVYRVSAEGVGPGGAHRSTPPCRTWGTWAWRQRVR